MSDPPAAIVGIIETAWILTSDKRGQWDSMVKSMSKRKTDALMALDLNTISDLDFFEAKVVFEDVKASLEQNPKQLNVPTEALYEWEQAAFCVFDETKKALGTSSELEKKKEELFNQMILLSKQRKKYEVLKAERDKFTKYRNSLEAKSSLLNELHQLLALENEDWKGISEWQAAYEKVIAKQESLLSDALFAAGVLTYFGPFSWVSRNRLKEQWVKIHQELGFKVRENPQISVILGEPQQLSEWHVRNLLRDETCIENAFILTYSSRWPLLIDPEGAAAKWMGGKDDLKDTNTYFKDELMKKMSQGNEVLLHISKESLDIDVVQLLELPRKRASTIKMLLPSDKAKLEVHPDPHKADVHPVEIHPNFGINLRIEHSNPIFPDDVYAVTNVINFALPPKALHDQFAIEYGNCVGAGEYSEIILQKEDRQVWECANLENILLQQVNQVAITRIDEEDQRNLKEHIHDTMKNLMDIRKRLGERKEETKKENIEKINAVVPLATRASILYRCASSLTNMNPMYLFTYGFIKEHFAATVKGSTDAMSFQPSQQMNIGQLKESLNKLVGVVTNSVMTALEKAMFGADFLRFAFYFAMNLAVETKDLTVDEWMVFLYGPEYIPLKGVVNSVKNPLSHRISEKWWNVLGYLEKTLPEIYKGLSQDMLMRVAEWELWATSKTPHLSALPGELQKRALKPLQLLVLMRIVCPEHIPECQEWAASSVIGDSYLQIKHPTVAEVFTKETKINKPLLIIKEEGEDPTAEVMKLGGEEIRIDCTTLTQDTDAEIRRNLDNCKRPSDKAERQWFFIRDIHTMPEFGKYVADKIKELTVMMTEQHSTSEVNDKWFRLVLSCNPCRLPRGVLNHCVRLALQPPVTMKQKVARDVAFFQKQEAFALSLPANKEKFTPQYRRLALSLSILHAVLEKRNIFGHRAWSKPFIITSGEIDVAGKLIAYILDAFKDPQLSSSSSAAGVRPAPMPWDPMRKLMSEICLGGRLLEEYDLKTLSCLVDMYLNEDAANGNYAFRESSQYRIPAQGTFPELLKHVEGLTSAEDYELCNMAPDVTLIGQRNEFENILREIQKVEQRKNMNGEKEKVEDVKIETVIAKIMEEMPENGLTKEDINPVVLELKKGSLYGHHMFLLQEMARYNSLIKNVQDVLARINNHLQTGSLMPASLERIYFSLASGRVPEEFIGYAWNHPLGEWITTFKKRIEYMREWLKAGEAKGYWLRALIHPKGLFNALLMYFAQKYEQNMEALSFVFEVTPYKQLSEIKEPEPQTGYIYDLYMMNARYNSETNVLEEFTHEEQMRFRGPLKYSRMPIVAITPTNEAKEERGDFECPVYYLPSKVSKIGSLENLVTKIDCPTDLKSQYWILKEVFMTCIDPELNA